jgi:hypothetical protein
MANLRWILLAAGAALVVALLIIGRLRGRQAARASAGRDVRRLDEPTLGILPEVDSPEPAVIFPAVGRTMAAEPLAGTFEDAAGVDAGRDSIVAVPPLAEPAGGERPSIADWPPAEQRIICSLRIVSTNQDRLSGRRVRQGLQSAGFMHGDLAIFHLPARANRAMLSAASLSQPGQLDPAQMDYQRFAGVHIFTVLPGRVAPAMALEQLYAVSAEVARRIDGRVHDHAGRLLEPEHVDDWLHQQLQLAATVRGVTSAAAAG